MTKSRSLRATENNLPTILNWFHVPVLASGLKPFRNTILIHVTPNPTNILKAFPRAVITPVI